MATANPAGLLAAPPPATSSVSSAAPTTGPTTVPAPGLSQGHQADQHAGTSSALASQPKVSSKPAEPAAQLVDRPAVLSKSLLAAKTAAEPAGLLAAPPPATLAASPSDPTPGNQAGKSSGNQADQHSAPSDTLAIQPEESCKPAEPAADKPASTSPSLTSVKPAVLFPTTPAGPSFLLDTTQCSSSAALSHCKSDFIREDHQPKTPRRFKSEQIVMMDNHEQRLLAQKFEQQREAMMKNQQLLMLKQQQSAQCIPPSLVTHPASSTLLPSATPKR